MTKFSEWLEIELDKRKWTKADLARISKISPSQITRIFSGGRGVGTDSIVKIARALKMPEDIVFLASIGKPIKPEEKWIKEITHKIQSLPSSLRKVAEGLIDSMLNNGNNQ